MKSKKIFLIYRIYNKKEIEDGFENHLYGWSDSAALIKLFLMQRDYKKYRVDKITDEELAEELSENNLDEELKMNYVNLISVKNNTEVKFYTNKYELQEIEVRIQDYFNSLCSLNDYEYNTIVSIVMMLSNLDYIYEEALDVIGYRPPEMDSLFPGNGEFYGDDIINEIIDGYSYFSINKKHEVPGLHSVSSLPRLILYSLESVIMVTYKDM